MAARLTPELKEKIIAHSNRMKGTVTNKAKQLSGKYGFAYITMIRLIRTDVKPAKILTEEDMVELYNLYLAIPKGSDHAKFKQIIEQTGWSMFSVVKAVKTMKARGTEVKFFNPKMEMF